MLLCFLLINAAVYLEAIAPSFSGLSTSMFANSYESDFIYLRYSPHTTYPGATHPGGVFVTHDFKPTNIICQPRGHLIPMENLTKINISSLLTYYLTAPAHSAEGEDELKQFVLIDNTICSRIRFCFPKVVGDEGLGSCGNAALFYNPEVVGLMLLVKAIKDIPYGTEVVVELHHHYILSQETFQEMCQFDPHGCGVPFDEGFSPKELGIVSSESFALYIAPSSIPGSGMGLFTKYEIRPYQIVTLCQGKVFKVKHYHDSERGDRLTAPLNTPHGDITLQMDNYCGYANDIIDISFLENTSYNYVVPTLSHLTYNAGQGGAEYRIVALISMTAIPAHAEIFQSYGESYWQYRYQQRHALRADEL